MKESLCILNKIVFVFICPCEKTYIEHSLTYLGASLPVLALNKWPGLGKINSIDQELKCLKHMERLMLVPQTP